MLHGQNEGSLGVSPPAGQLQTVEGSRASLGNQANSSHPKVADQLAGRVQILGDPLLMATGSLACCVVVPLPCLCSQVPLETSVAQAFLLPAEEWEAGDQKVLGCFIVDHGSGGAGLLWCAQKSAGRTRPPPGLFNT